MFQITFKNLQKSELAKDVVEEKLSGLIEKFPDLTKSRLFVTLERENSRIQAGPDLYSVSLFISRGRYDGIKVTKSDQNLYFALADVQDHMLERLNRFGDRKRVKDRTVQRKGPSRTTIGFST